MTINGDADGSIDAHQARLESFCEAGGPLTRDSANATVNNPDWFTRIGGKAVPTPSRLKVHERILAEARKRAPNVGHDRQAIVLAGPPGAGKSSALAKLVKASGKSEDQFRVFNPDDFKDDLLDQSLKDGSYDSKIVPPEVKAAEARGDRFQPREMASLVHDESAMLNGKALDDAIKRGQNVVVDGTLSHRPSADRLMATLQKEGYQVRVASVEAPLSSTQARITHRWRSGYEQAANKTATNPRDARLGGRMVPASYARSLYPKGRPERSVCSDVARSVASKYKAVQYSDDRVFHPKGGPLRVGEQARGAKDRAPAKVTGRTGSKATPRPSAVPLGPASAAKRGIAVAAAKTSAAARTKVKAARTPPPPKPRPRPDRGFGR